MRVNGQGNKKNWFDLLSIILAEILNELCDWKTEIGLEVCQISKRAPLYMHEGTSSYRDTLVGSQARSHCSGRFSLVSPSANSPARS